MSKKNTIASLRIKNELKERSLNGVELAKLANISYYDTSNILAGKSSKIEKIEAIAKALGKPLTYFIDANYDSTNIQSASYDSELHYKVVKLISEICNKNKIFLTKEKMDEFVNTIYPKMSKNDPEDLMFAQTEAIINYITSKHNKPTS
jgi:transcriptional regulator with XRE-family HTH domain